MGSKTKGEVTAIYLVPGKPIDNAKLAYQKNQHDIALSANGLAARSSFDPTGLAFIPFDLLAVGIKSAVAKEKQRYEATYTFSIKPENGHSLLNDSTYFYSKMSRKGIFDATDMQFSGFKILRAFKGKSADTLTPALIAEFAVDTCNLYELAYENIFRLKMKELQINYAKAKLAKGKEKVNLDIDVRILTSYITKEGQYFKDVEIGCFSKTLKNLEVGKSDGVLKITDVPMKGWSYIVPRSYIFAENNDLWGQGSYSILVTVKETGSNKKINKYSSDRSDILLKRVNDGVNVKEIIKMMKTHK
jgi:hypothetical protein